jgi:hypothetical protein
MTISLAFLAPDLVKAAIDGRLPHGMGVVWLSDMPAEWCRQHLMPGFNTPLFEPSLCPTRFPLPGNRISRPETTRPKSPSTLELSLRVVSVD